MEARQLSCRYGCSGTPALSCDGERAIRDTLRRQGQTQLKAWLEASGWEVSVIWGRAHGIDLEAKKNGLRWIIEAKGCGSRNPMRANYFLSILGELLQRMDDPDARYSIALPDMQQFRRLWQRLPQLAKARTTISALFVSPSGKVEEVLFPS